MKIAQWFIDAETSRKEYHDSLKLTNKGCLRRDYIQNKKVCWQLWIITKNTQTWIECYLLTVHGFQVFVPDTYENHELRMKKLEL